MKTQENSRRQAALGGIFLGIGLGGFADGIVLHQILQWHNMLSSYLPPITMEAMKINMLWDGLFHLFTWLSTAVGVGLLWSAAKKGTPLPSGQWFLGMSVLGWGLFNLVEGLVNHHILDIHHVHGSPSFFWDYGFLLVGGVGLIGLGWLLVKTGRPAESRHVPFQRPKAVGE